MVIPWRIFSLAKGIGKKLQIRVAVGIDEARSNDQSIGLDDPF